MTSPGEGRAEYDRQAEFSEEELHLETVIGTIDATVQHRRGRGKVSAGDAKAADIVKELLDVQLVQIEGIRDRPYFGRIDYSTASENEIRTLYIGDLNVDHEDPRYFIASRNAPIARLYYRPVDGFYEVRKVQRQASVHLKRTLTIEDARLIDFDDVLRLPSAPSAALSTSNRALDNRLSSSGRTRLSDAVETIQPEQYEQIASTQKPVLIVQGAAGSGKSLVGLHRIDFILSPFSDIGSLRRPTAERVIMLGPSPAFLKYVSGLLPGLGVHKVRQTTVKDWLLSQFSSRVTLSSRDKIFDDLMNNRRKLSQAEIEAHQFKAGPKMRRLIDNYVAHLKKRLRARIDQAEGLVIPCDPGTPPMELGAALLKSRVAESFKANAEPNLARDHLVNGLAWEWARLNPRRLKARSEVAAEARRKVDGSLAFIWPRLDFRVEYVDLVSSTEKIVAHARKGDVDPSEADEIVRTARSRARAGQALSVTDLAAALYLDYAINGYESERFEHVVVDEAQDVSPLELVLLQMHSANGTFTILGDLRQSALPYKSIGNWNQFASLFERESVSRLDSRLTYRSTRQITQYANRILKGLPERTKTPVPHGRGGSRPELVRSKSAAEMKMAIANSVQELSSLDDVSSVAVLTKWRKTANDVAEVLTDEGIDSLSVLIQGGVIATDVTVSPIILTKGLEFDAVIVANAAKGNFNESDFDRMLLYLACTRARHHLQIHWYGSRSPIVPDVARLSL